MSKKSLVSVPASVAKFSAWIISESRENMCGFDGGELEDRMREDGVLVSVMASKPCGESCECATYGDFPTECVRYADDVYSFIRESKKWA